MEFKPVAKLVLKANELPRIEDLDDDFLKILASIKFPRTYHTLFAPCKSVLPGNSRLIPDSTSGNQNYGFGTFGV